MTEPRRLLTEDGQIDSERFGEIQSTSYGGYMTFAEAGHALRECVGVINHLIVQAAGERALRAEATAAAEQRLRGRIEALTPFGEATHDADWGWRDCRNAVLALLDSDTPPPASPRQGEPES